MPGDELVWDVEAFTEVFAKLILGTGASVMVLVLIVTWAYRALDAAHEDERD